MSSTPAAGRAHAAAHVRTESVRAMFRGAAGTAVLQGASQGLGFITSVVLARAMGSSDYGIYALAFAWTGLLTVPALLGFDRLLVRGLAAYRAQEQWAQARGLLRRAHELVLAASIVILAGGCLIALLVLSSPVRAPFAIGMALVPITAITLLRQGALQALGLIVASQLPEYLIRPLIILAALGVLLVVRDGALTPSAALSVAVGATAVACMMGAWQLRRALPSVIRHVRPRYETRAWLHSAVPMMMVGGLWLANSYAGTIVVGGMGGSRAAGIYSVTTKGGALVALVLTAANTSLAPAIARLSATGRRGELERVVQRVAQLGFLASIPICAAFVLAPDLFLSLFGPPFRDGATALRIVACGQLANALAGPCGNVLIMSGQERAAVVGIVSGLVSNVLLGMALVPTLGVTGGAIAFAASLVVWNVAFTLTARLRVGINATALPVLAMARQGAGI